MQNVGKDFEARIRKAAPEYAKMFRIPDSAQSFGGGGNLRFSNKPPFDFFMWDSIGHILFALELKTVEKKSISFERDAESGHGQIRYHQICGLREWARYDGTVCGFIIEFRALERTIFLSIGGFDRLSAVVGKKSFGIGDLNACDVHYIVIPQRKMRTHYKYDLDSMVREVWKIRAEGGRI